MPRNDCASLRSICQAPLSKGTTGIGEGGSSRSMVVRGGDSIQCDMRVQYITVGFLLYNSWLIINTEKCAHRQQQGFSHSAAHGA